MDNKVRIGLRVPECINRDLKKAAAEEYMTKNAMAIRIFIEWLGKRKPKTNEKDVAKCTG